VSSDGAKAMAASLSTADRRTDWSEVNAVVLGLGISGFAAADALLRMNATVTVLDHVDDEVRVERGRILSTLGAQVQLGGDLDLATDRETPCDLLVPSPGFPPSHPWIEQFRAGTIWSGEQLAWNLRPLERPAPWLTLTGTNGKTTTAEMLSSILRLAGHRAVAVGNVGRPLVEAVFAEPPYDVLPVELSSFQLHWSDRLAPHASALLNIAPDHLDWHGSMAAYVADKSKIFNGTTDTIVYNADDARTEELARAADVAEGCRAVGFTLGIPEIGMLGVVAGTLVDRAFTGERRTHAQELCDISDLAVSGSHNVANALAAAALALSWGVPIPAIRRGLLAYEGEPHRLKSIARIGDVEYVDDSKATNVSAADVALQCFPRVVWIAGGLAKGGQFDDLVSKHHHRLSAVVLLGRDRELIRQAVERHAPEVPVIEVADSETEPMDHAVREAASLARPKDTVLLAPACASMDLFPDYSARGDAFAHAVDNLSR